MKKILIAFEGTSFSTGALEFAKKMNDHSPVSLTGIFLPQVDFANLWSYAASPSGSLFIPLLEEDDSEAVQKNMDRFESFCSKHDIKCNVHKDFTDFAIPALKKESRFADLLIIGSESFFASFGKDAVNDNVKDALHFSECPVIVVPEKFKYPEMNILSYNGSDDSVFAIKQFAYLFPELHDKPTLLVYVVKKADDEFPDGDAIEELVSRHFSNLTLLKLDLDSKRMFNLWAEDQKPAILVSGAFSRSSFVQIFRKSFVESVISDHKIPLFIAHK